VALISAVMIVGSVATLIAGRAAQVDVGMDTTSLYMMGVDLPEEQYPTAAEQALFNARLLTELRASPGVETARVMHDLGPRRFAVAGADYRSPGDRPLAFVHVWSDSPVPLGPALLEGRTIDSSDTATSLKTALVSRELAREQWPGRSALGETIDVAIGNSAPEPRVVVGIVADVTYDPVGMVSSGNAAIYLPLPQQTVASTNVTLRFNGDEAAARSAMYEALARIDPTIAPSINAYEDALGRLTLFARTITRLFAGCGAFAVLLAGIYGMSSNAVVLRTREIGLRRALGASNRSVLGLFLKHSVRQLAVGLSLSALLAVAVLAVVSQGFSLGAGELASIGAVVTAVISGTVLLSVYVSVRSAVRLDPSLALRRG
jgi:ABC-type antimicrobial peptide transport system permease subunit